MNLVRFLFLGSFLSLLLGEFGRYPFGSSSGSVQLSDLLLTLTLVVFIIWKVISKEKVYFPKFSKYLFGFWVTGLVSLIVSLLYFAPIDVAKGSLYLFRFIIYSSTALIAFNIYRSNSKFKSQYLNWLTGIGIIFAMLGFIQLLVLSNFDYLTQWGFDPHQNRLTSTFLDPNFAGVFLSLIIGLNLIKINKNRLLILGILIIALILTFSRTGYLMSVFIIAGYCFTRYKKLLLGLLVGLILLILFVPRVQQRLIGAINGDKSSSARIESWQNGISIFLRYPLTGVGFDNYRTAQSEFNLFPTYSAEGGHSGSGNDSSLIFVFATTGILGGAVYLLLWSTIFLYLIKKQDFFSKMMLYTLGGLFIGSQFINGLFFTPIMFVIYSLLGFIYEE